MIGAVLGNASTGSEGATASIFVTGLLQIDSVTGAKPDGTSMSAVWTSREVEGVAVNGWLFRNLTSYGSYTITASNGTTTKTETVLIDEATDFDIEVVL